MSVLSMTPAEQNNIDSQIEQMMGWVQEHKIEAEQLALDSARLLACTSDRLSRAKNQGFFRRCWNRFTGKTGEMERANADDMMEMQKKAFRYLNMLQEQQVLMAHSLLSLKNNLIALAVSEAETRDMIGALAQRTQEKFEELENRTDQLEVTTNLQGWLLGLEEREYDRKYPTPYMRMFRIINDFYNIKKDNWNYNDLMFMRTALRKAGIDPRTEISLSDFINALTDEIQNEKVGMEKYTQMIETYAPKNAKDYNQFVLENISSPVMATIHGLRKQFTQASDIVEVLQDELSISAIEAQKRILQKIISNMNVEMNHAFSLGEAAIEIMGCLRLIDNMEIPLDIIESVEATEAQSGQESIEYDFSDLPVLIKKLYKISKDINSLSSLDKCIPSYIDPDGFKKNRNELKNKLDDNLAKAESLVEEITAMVNYANNAFQNLNLKIRINNKFPEKPVIELPNERRDIGLLIPTSTTDVQRNKNTFAGEITKAIKYVSHLQNALLEIERHFYVVAEEK